MAKIMLLRHAKSDWGTGHVDHDRPLNDRGRKAAAMMGRYMSDEGLVPEQVICSTAARARETLALVMEAAGFECSVQYEPALYGASSSTILNVIRQGAGEAGALLLVGHNPGFEDTACQLSEGEMTEDARKLRLKYPTCALTVFSFPATDLAAAFEEEATLDRFITPKMLG